MARMKKSITHSLTGACALAALALLPSAALASGPATVSVRIEGADGTLLPRTQVTTTTAAVVKDGNPAHSCTGTSVAGALQQATGGDWGASWADGLGYFVTSLKGAAPPDPSSYFALWVNERSSQTGICDTELQDGDRVLFFLDRCDYDAQVGGCANQPVLPLGLSAPDRAVRGKPFSVRVVRYAADGTPAPVAGATVAGGAAPAVTGADGTASVTAAGESASLRAEKAGFARSDMALTTLCAALSPAGACLSATGTVVAPPRPGTSPGPSPGSPRCATTRSSPPPAARAFCAGRSPPTRRASRAWSWRSPGATAAAARTTTARARPSGARTAAATRRARSRSAIGRRGHTCSRAACRAGAG